MDFKRTLTILALAASASAAADDVAEWQFDVLLDDKKIGYHSFNLSRNGGEQVLETEASFDVKVLFITAFRYRHENVEVWKNGCLAKMSAKTNSNGKELSVEGRVEADRFEVDRTEGVETLGSCVQSFAYWNPAILGSSQLLNSQTGEYEDISVKTEDDEQVLVDGTPVGAQRYTLTAKGGDIKLWYAKDDGRWLSLEAPAKGGRTIRYEPVAIPEPQTFGQFTARSDNNVR
ncbi:MAG: DUF6134 family protein [Woeseiaceae bacterium]|nr:DUF6134 family protein [Woeseiaceae bacterium]